MNKYEYTELFLDNMEIFDKNQTVQKIHSISQTAGESDLFLKSDLKDGLLELLFISDYIRFMSPDIANLLQ